MQQGHGHGLQKKRTSAIRVGATAKPRVSQDLINFSAMKLFDRFRKSCLMRFMIFSFPSSKGSQTKISSSSGSGSVPRRRSCDDPPKTSCSSNYYSPDSHYSEAFADCIEFLNKSHEEAILPALDITSDSTL